jgi:hypothetical protein
MESNKLQKKIESSTDGWKITSTIKYIAKLNGIKDLKTEDLKFAAGWLKNNMWGITLDEVLKASEMALKGHLTLKNELFGTVSPKYLAELIQKYKFYKSEKEKYNTPALPEKTISEAEKTSIIRNNLITTFEKYKDSGVMPLAAYDVLFSFGWHKITKYPEEIINKIKIEAEDYYKNDYELEKTKVINVLELRLLIDRFKDINTKHVFKSKCKELYLKRYFDDLIDMNENIENFI